MEQTSAPTRLPFWATPLVAGLAVLVLTLPRAVLAGRVGLIGDEAYYAIWSFHPGFGYFDHAPAVAWVVWLGRALFGESEFAVRSMFLAANLVTSAALYRLGELLTGDRRVGAVAAIFYAVVPAAFISFTVATPDGPSTLFWVLCLWAVAEFTRSRNANWWLAAGAFAGLGLLSKYTFAFLGLGLIVYLVSARERRAWLKLWQVWVGGALAVALFAPVLWIYSQRDWNSLRFQLGRSSLEHPQFSGFYEIVRFLTEEAILLLPTLFVFVVIAIALFFARRAKALALPILTSVPMVGYFLVHALFGRVNPNWTAPLFAVLALAGAWAIVNVRPRKLAALAARCAARPPHPARPHPGGRGVFRAGDARPAAHRPAAGRRLRQWLARFAAQGFGAGEGKRRAAGSTPPIIRCMAGSAITARWPAIRCRCSRPTSPSATPIGRRWTTASPPHRTFWCAPAAATCPRAPPRSATSPAPRMAAPSRATKSSSSPERPRHEQPCAARAALEARSAAAGRLSTSSG